MFAEGTITRIDGKTCIIHGQDQGYRAYIRKKIKGANPTEVKPVAVGDHVRFEIRNPQEVLITELLPRRSFLARRSVKRLGKQQVVVSNVDQLLIVVSLQSPPFHEGIIDRFLIAAQKGGLASIIVLNKFDLKDKEPQWPQIEAKLLKYGQLGYPVIYTSIYGQRGQEELQRYLQGKSSVIAGHSGVGKSSLISALDPNIQLKTAEVSEKSQKGRHTTTSVLLLPWHFGGFIVDTPGIREFSLWQLQPQEISHYYPEMLQRAHCCKFRQCSHTHEPACAIKQAMAAGEIAEFRYENYCRILQSLSQEDKPQPIKPDKI